MNYTRQDVLVSDCANCDHHQAAHGPSGLGPCTATVYVSKETALSLNGGLRYTYLCPCSTYEGPTEEEKTIKRF